VIDRESASFVPTKNDNKDACLFGKVGKFPEWLRKNQEVSHIKTRSGAAWAAANPQTTMRVLGLEKGLGGTRKMPQMPPSNMSDTCVRYR
jgi:hypothetical protein